MSDNRLINSNTIFILHPKNRYSDSNILDVKNIKYIINLDGFALSEVKYTLIPYRNRFFLSFFLLILG